MSKQTKLKTCQYLAENNKHFEGAMTQGNGFLNMRGSFEEDLDGEMQDEIYWRLPANVTLETIRNPVTKWGVYIPGIYGKHPILGEELINLPYLIGINLYCGKERFDMKHSRYSDYEKNLDMRDGVLTRKVLWYTQHGNVEVIWKRYLSMEQKNCVFQTIDFRAQYDMDIVIENFIDGNVTTNGYNHFRGMKIEHEDALEMYLETDSGQHVGMKTKILSEGICRLSHGAEGKRAEETWRLHLCAGENHKLEKIGIVVADMDGNQELQKNMKEIEAGISNAEEELVRHRKRWRNLWDRAEVFVKGDEELEFHLRFCTYHLLRAANDSSSVAIDAKGYAGEAYFGHYFWDTEIYLLPFYIYTQPEQAKKLVEYRYNTLAGAKKNAEKYGYRGARYPWESCISGEEQCPNWQYADHEIHVTADVIFGLLLYCRITGDERFLEEKGLKMMTETARYWGDRVEVRDGSYHLTGVMGPDEYLPFTSDNAFTNYMVAFVLKETADLIERASEEKRNELGITESDCKYYREISEKIYIPYDTEKKFIWQSADFSQYMDLDFDRIWKDRNRPFGSCISQEKNYRSKALKQADTVSLLYLFRDQFDKELKKNCITYYEPITTHDSSLSYIIHSLVYGEIGDRRRSYEYAVKSMKLDWEEEGAAEGIHIANAGGLWQGVLCGFAGLRGVDEEGQVKICPNLPEHISEVRFSACVKGKWYKIRVTDQKTEIKEA